MNPKRLTSSRIDGLRGEPGGRDCADRDCPGLLLHVAETGTKSWHFRYYWKGKRLKLTLGRYPAVGILAAHDSARKARELLAKGIDPRRAGIAANRLEPVPAAMPSGAPTDAAHTIETLIHEYLEHYVAKRGKNPAAARERVRSLLEKELRSWAGRDARSIRPREVVELLDAIVRRGSPVMANRFAGTLSKLFKLGVQRAVVEENPVQILIKPGGKEKPRKRALSDDELATLLASADDVFTHARRTAAAIRLILHTACRRSEIALARWSHFKLDGDAPQWTVPEELSKTGVKYIIPLVPAAVAELKRLKVNARGSAYVFPAKWSETDRAGDPMILTRSLARNLDRLRKRGIKEPFTLHDLRRTTRTGLARLKVPPHVAELVLNHAQRGIVGTYDVHAYLEEKRDALEKWASHIAALTATNADGQMARTG
jgi:integrase